MERATVAYSIPWRRGAYVARINGPHDRFGLDREFETGSAVKSGGGTLKYRLPAGYYEARDGFGKVPRYYRNDGLGMFPLASSELALIGKAAQGPDPGEPGSWGDDRCICTGPVAAYDAAGFPTCADHLPDDWQGPEGSPA